MKRIVFYAVTVFSLGVVSWGVGGCGGGGTDETSVDVINPENFTGTYEKRDESCESPIIDSFRINTSDTLLTVIDGGGSELQEGDIFSLSEGELPNGKPTIEADGLFCLGTFAVNQAEADEVASNSLLDVQVGDLVIVCADDSADGNCALSFARTAE